MIQSTLLIVIAVYRGDVERATDLLGWIKELGGAKPHSLLMVLDDVDGPDKEKLKALAKESFDYVGVIPAGVAAAWAPNRMFLSAAKWISECARLPWLWLEPDAIPLREGWADSIADEYDANPMKFLGPIVRQKGQPGLPEAHLTGTAVYPPDAWEAYKAIPALTDKVVAWDIETAGAIVPRTKASSTIAHFYGKKDLAPHFTESKSSTDPENFVTLDFIPKQAAVYHRCKDGSLIKLLRKQRNSKNKTNTPPQK